MLELLRPSRYDRIIDCVAEAGIDVEPWSKNDDGSPANVAPTRNPKYCYEWAFGGDGEPTALCVWHDNLRQSGAEIYCENNLRNLALRLDAVAEDRFGDPEVANRSKTQAKRARRFDLKLQHAFRKQEEVRLILLAGTQRDLQRLGYDSSEVDYRQLDNAAWIVTSYDDRTGAFKLVRGGDLDQSSPEDRAYEAVSRLSVDEYADAFLAVDALLTGAQREMLVGHALAPNRTLSMERIALLGGYDSYATANLQYGNVGSRIADVLRIQGLANQIQSFCELQQEKDEKGHDQWTLRQPALDALLQLEIVAIQESNQPQDILLVDAESMAYEMPTTRKALIDARLGQGAYRKKMLRWWGGACAVSGCTVSAALVASHAVPWKDCNSHERLDHHNGLLLTATLDRLFDAGLIGFASDGRLLISPRLSNEERRSLGLSDGMRLRKTSDQLEPYLARHRLLHSL